MGKFKYKLAPITAFLMIQDTLKEAHEKKQFLLLIGSSGYGKSIGLKHYIVEYNNTIYIKARPAESCRPFFVRLNNLLEASPIRSVNNPNASTDWLIETSSFEIKDKRQDSLLIIDEAGVFKKYAQAFLRQLWDNIQGSSGFVIAGPDRYQINLNNWMNDLSSGIPELVTRIERTIVLPEPSFEDINLICSHNEISDKKIIRYIFSNSGNLRDVKNLVEAYHDGLLDI